MRATAGPRAPAFANTNTLRRADRFQRRGRAACHAECRLIAATGRRAILNHHKLALSLRLSGPLQTASMHGDNGPLSSFVHSGSAVVANRGQSLWYEAGAQRDVQGAGPRDW
jgi:hypothetical protein